MVLASEARPNLGCGLGGLEKSTGLVPRGALTRLILDGLGSTHKKSIGLLRQTKLIFAFIQQQQAEFPVELMSLRPTSALAAQLVWPCEISHRACQRVRSAAWGQLRYCCRSSSLLRCRASFSRADMPLSSHLRFLIARPYEPSFKVPNRLLKLSAKVGCANMPSRKAV